MADIGGIQLLPQTRRRLDVSIPGSNRMLIGSLVFVVLVGLIYGVLAAYQSSLAATISTIDQQLTEIEKSRDKNLENHLLALNQQLSVASGLLNNHILWSNALDRIQNLIEPSVQFEYMTISLDKKTLNFKATADSYTTVARQIAAFYTSDVITDVALNKVTSQATGRVEFEMELTLDTNKFLNKIQPVPPSTKS